ncbi:MAG: HEAT repeat domain-containing protein [Clostridia bacterium]|nr:HEAT repeat domain-containing protein [Clostridia bacterium]
MNRGTALIPQRKAVVFILAFFLTMTVTGCQSRVEMLIHQLENTDEQSRQRIVAELVNEGNAAVTPLISAVENGSEPVKLGAAEALGSMGDQIASETLITVLENKSESEKVRCTAARSLGLLHETRAIDSLVLVLREDALEIKKYAAEALVRIGEPAVEKLTGELKIMEPGIDLDENKALDYQNVGKLESGNPGVNAKQVLIKIGSPAVPGLVNIFKESDQKARTNAMEILIKIGVPSIEPLKALLKEESPEIRKCALYGLACLKDQDSAAAIIPMLKNSDMGVRKFAAFSLGCIQEPASIKPLIDAMCEENSETRSAGTQAVFRFGSAATKQLELKLKEPSLQTYAKIEIIQALSEIGDRASQDSLTAILKDPDEAVRKSAANALAKMDETAREYLISLLNSRNMEIIAHIYSYYIQIGVEGSENLLIQALEHYADKEMAMDYLNSENDKLKNAAIQWAKRRGYYIVSIPGDRGGPIWREKKQK